MIPHVLYERAGPGVDMVGKFNLQPAHPLGWGADFVHTEGPASIDRSPECHAVLARVWARWRSKPFCCLAQSTKSCERGRLRRCAIEEGFTGMAQR
jgi:hypothetical protein